MRTLLLPIGVMALLPVTATAATTEEPVEYGVDVSFPMHYEGVSTNYPWLEHNMNPSKSTPKQYKDMVIQPLGDRQKAYDELIQGCVDMYGKRGRSCYSNEQERIAMSLRQPQSMQNYTEIGFKKIKAPTEVFSLIKKFWENNYKEESMVDERWPAGNTYTNHWTAPTKMLSVENTKLRGGGSAIKKKIWDAARTTIQEWTGEELTECSLYGIRVYTEGAVLATHVDRLPLVSSAIINVAQDVDEPWPLEVIGHDGKAHNVTMEPGDMVLYESHSILHGRPFPLKGRYFANIFIHFEPTGHSLRHNAKVEEDKKDVHEKYKEATARRTGGHEADDDNNNGLPPYIIPGTPEEENWRRRHQGGYNRNKRSISSFATGSTDAHMYAQGGDLEGLKHEVETKGKHLVNKEDANGWTPLHEAARGGHDKVVKFLYENGADVNKRTNENIGGTALYYAKSKFGAKHPVSKFLESVGGEYIEPEL